jgi:hypothetical protein
MTNDDTAIEYIKKNLLLKNNTLNSAFIRWINNSDELNYILDRTNYLKDDCKYTERIFHILNNIHNRPVCHCGKDLKFISLNSGYSKSCNNGKCIRIDKSWKTSSTRKKEYNRNLLDEFKKFIHKKLDNFTSFEDTVSFINNLLVSTDYGRQHNFVDSRKLRQNFEIFVSILNHTKYIKPYDLGNIQKIEDFCFSERMFIIKNDLKDVPLCPSCKTNNRKYISFIKGYGRACSNRCYKNDTLNKIEEGINEQGFHLQNTFSDRLQDSSLELLCEKCGTTHERILTNARWKNIYCQGCYGNKQISKEEDELFSYILSLDSTAIQSFRINAGNFKKEFDIVLPSINLAIEYDGVYWHSAKCKDQLIEFRNKHLEKTELANSMNIQLFHIFSSEWKNKYKQEIWKSMIDNKLNKNKRIFARKCEVRIVSSEISEFFLEENHLQGKDKASIRYGLFHDNELCALMTFNKAKYNKNYEWELSRFCNKKFLNVTGGANKLLHHFIKYHNSKSIITYANRRYSNGRLYEMLGFKKIEMTKPNYFYFKTENKLFSRNYFQKHLLEKRLKIFDKNLSEFDNMFNNDYRVIFDCGNISYKL